MIEPHVVGKEPLEHYMPLRKVAFDKMKMRSFLGTPYLEHWA